MGAQFIKAMAAARGVVVGVDPVFPTVYYNPDPYSSGFQMYVTDSNAYINATSVNPTVAGSIVTTYASSKDLG